MPEEERELETPPIPPSRRSDDLCYNITRRDTCRHKVFAAMPLRLLPHMAAAAFCFCYSSSFSCCCCCRYCCHLLLPPPPAAAAASGVSE
jgi:hypothetical protein